jgi:hypothetical protein
MTEAQTSPSRLKIILIAIPVGIAVGIIATLAQVYFLGKSNGAVTGAVVGSLCGGMLVALSKKGKTRS